jgi:hypothetical protein
MSPKPPMGRQASRFKSLAALGALVLGVAGAAFAAATPALADPAPTFTQVGSDTTTNIMDFFAGQAGGGTLGSFDAVNPVTQGTTDTIQAGPALGGGAQELCNFSRPNGSGAGFKALDLSSAPNSGISTGLAINPSPGCISASRSSGAPGSIAGSGVGSSLATGNFIYIPFAIDALTWATGPTSATAVTTQCGSGTPTGYTCSNTTGSNTGTVSYTADPTNISQDLNLSISQLQTLYHSCASLTVGSVTLNPTAGVFNFSATSASPAVFTATGSAYANGAAVVLSGSSLPGGFTAGTQYFVVNASGTSFSLAATSGGTAINSTSTGFGIVNVPGAVDLYAPQAGSGTLSFWESEMGNAGVTESCWHQTILAGPATGVAVEEHDGTAGASDPNGIWPNSIAKWLGMNNGNIVPDVRHGSTLQPIVAAPVAFTATSASPAVFTTSSSLWTGANGTEVQLTGTSLPGGFSANTDYFAVATSGNTFELAATSGGTAIASTSSGSGNVNITVQPINSGGNMNVAGCLTGTHLNQALCAPITRPVYNVVNYYEVQSTAPTLQSAGGVAISFTATDANPAVFTASGSDYANGQLVTLIGSSLPGGFAAGTNYYACNVNDGASTFELCSTPLPGVASPASAPLASSSAGSGGVSDNPAYSPLLASLFNGTGSSLCLSSFTIQSIGFANIPSANSAVSSDTCGNVADSGLRVQMNSTAAQG